MQFIPQVLTYLFPKAPLLFQVKPHLTPFLSESQQFKCHLTFYGAGESIAICNLHVNTASQVIYVNYWQMQCQLLQRMLAKLRTP